MFFIQRFFSISNPAAQDQSEIAERLAERDEMLRRMQEQVEALRFAVEMLQDAAVLKSDLPSSAKRPKSNP